MKFDLLLSDLVASIVGLLGLLASAITLQKALAHWMHGDPSIGANMAAFAFALFLFSSSFLIAKTYNWIIAFASLWPIRAPFFFLCTLWLLGIAFVFETTTPQDLASLPSYVPWLFSAQTVAIIAVLFVLVFLLPGLAYRPYRLVRASQGRPDIPAGRPHIEHATAHVDAHSLQHHSGATPARARNQKSVQDRRGPVTKVLGNVFGLVAFAIIGLGLYGMAYAQFISSAAHVAEVKQISVGIILGTMLILFLWFYMGNDSNKGTLRNPVARFIMASVLIVPFSFVSIPAAQSGLPALLSLQKHGSYDRIVVSVVRRDRYASSRRGCDRRATVVWELHKRQLCNVPDHIWRDLRPGQKLELEGFLTDYGFRYQRMRRVS